MMKFTLPLTLCCSLLLGLFGACGHDHDGHDHDHGDEHQEAWDGNLHGEAHALGLVSLGEVRLKVTQLGDLEAGGEAVFDIEPEGEDKLSGTLRAWIGIDSAAGSRKARIGVEGGKLHGHVEVPESLAADSKLWLELEGENGTARAAIALHR